jgi:hypothetical protein
MTKKKSERHHWWPECVSLHWADEEGGVHWLLPNGEVRKSTPNNFGVIGNGHYIKLGRHSGETSPWDHNYESEFQAPDNNFPSLINWLKSLQQQPPDTSVDLSDRFHPLQATDEEIKKIVECIVSLAIRSPMNRESAVRLAEYLRGPLPERERNALIGANMHQDYKTAVVAIGTRGKFVIIHSPDQEFIYGDGFFHNLTSPLMTSPLSVKMFVPITPHIGILFAQPGRYRIDPRAFTLSITAEEAITLNNAIQIYSRDKIYFRSQKPNLLDDYKCSEHRRYADESNPIDYLIKAIPRVYSENLWAPF